MFFYFSLRLSKTPFGPPTGDYLGDLQSELEEGEYITKFAAGGPKNYTYQTNHNTTICKIRGFTLNYENSLMVNYDTMVKLILETLENNQTKPGIVTRNPSKIYGNKKTYSISNRYEEKLYSIKYSIFSPFFRRNLFNS